MENKNHQTSDSLQEIERLREIVNKTYSQLREQIKDERDQAFVIAAIGATFLMNVEDDQEFHDQILSVMLRVIINHPSANDGEVDLDGFFDPNPN